MNEKIVMIKPRIPLWFHIICGLFILAGLWLVADARSHADMTDTTAQFYGGLLSTIIFGLFWASALLVVLLRPVTLAIRPDGIQHFVAGGSTVIPWADISKIGATEISSVKMLGLRLTDHYGYLDNLLKRSVDGQGDPVPYPPHKVARLSVQMQTTRRTYGYDVLIPELLLDRTASQTILLIDEYRRGKL